MKSASKKHARKSTEPVASRAPAKRANTTMSSVKAKSRVMERVVLPSPLKPRHLTYAQIRRMVAKVAPGPVIVPR